jgi:hypothetical protein
LSSPQVRPGIVVLTIEHNFALQADAISMRAPAAWFFLIVSGRTRVDLTDTAGQESEASINLCVYKNK